MFRILPDHFLRGGVDRFHRLCPPVPAEMTAFEVPNRKRESAVRSNAIAFVTVWYQSNVVPTRRAAAPSWSCAGRAAVARVAKQKGECHVASASRCDGRTVLADGGVGVRRAAD